MATTGMSRGEVLGLQWDQVDLDHCRVSVVRSLVAVTCREVVLSEPKTAKGRRSVALDPATVAALESHRQAQRAEREVAGELPSPWTPTPTSYQPCKKTRSPRSLSFSENNDTGISVP